MKKSTITKILRKTRLIHLADILRFQLIRIKNYSKNNVFKLENPEVQLPADYLIYESFKMDYKRYYESGKNNAKWIKAIIEKHIELENIKILDWGCGPGRIIRHLPDVFGKTNEYFGTDYNKVSIDWCKKHLKGIQFNYNNLNPCLPYKDDFFDVIYGISIFTHLSEEMHFYWYKELIRVLKSGGVLFLTTHGDNFKQKLSDNELEKYNSGELVVRGDVKEGHRMFATFHPPKFLKNLFKNDVVLEHIVEPAKNDWIPQDVWLVKKK